MVLLFYIQNLPQMNWGPTEEGQLLQYSTTALTDILLLVMIRLVVWHQNDKNSNTDNNPRASVKAFAYKLQQTQLLH